jgi:hypothetical protein
MRTTWVRVWEAGSRPGSQRRRIDKQELLGPVGMESHRSTPRSPMGVTLSRRLAFCDGHEFGRAGSRRWTSEKRKADG